MTMSTLLMHYAGAEDKTLMRYLTSRGFAILGLDDQEGTERKADAVICCVEGGSICLPEPVKLSGLPVIAVTERRDAAADLLNDGADDVIVSPFDKREAEGRIKALIRRCEYTRTIKKGSSSLHANPYSRTVSLEGQTFNLPRREYKLLQTLIARPGHTFSRGELIVDAWGKDCRSGERTVDVHIKRVREKMEGFGRFIISTVRGQGYKLEFV